MATKAQLINFIMEFFVEPNGEVPAKSKLDGLKKNDLLEFVEARGAIDDLNAWLEQ